MNANRPIFAPLALACIVGACIGPAIAPALGARGDAAAR
jgi:hypothetical protein